MQPETKNGKKGNSKWPPRQNTFLCSKNRRGYREFANNFLSVRKIYV